MRRDWNSCNLFGVYVSGNGFCLYIQTDIYAIYVTILAGRRLVKSFQCHGKEQITPYDSTKTRMPRNKSAPVENEVNTMVHEENLVLKQSTEHNTKQLENIVEIIVENTAIDCITNNLDNLITEGNIEGKIHGLEIETNIQLDNILENSIDDTNLSDVILIVDNTASTGEIVSVVQTVMPGVADDGVALTNVEVVGDSTDVIAIQSENLKNSVNFEDKRKREEGNEHIIWLTG